MSLPQASTAPDCSCGRFYETCTFCNRPTSRLEQLARDAGVDPDRLRAVLRRRVDGTVDDPVGVR